MRIAMQCASTGWGGTEKWALRTAEELVRAGHSVLFTCRRRSQFAQRASLPLDFRHLPLGNDGDLYSLLQLARLYRKEVDVAILTRVRDYWLGGLACRLAGVPALLRLGVVRKPRSGHIMDRLRYGVLPGAVVVNARAIQETLVEQPWMRKKPIHVIHNGVDAPGPPEPAQCRTLRAEIGAPEAVPLIVGAGRLAVEKRWDWMLRGCHRLLEEGLPFRAAILGEGSEAARLKRLRDELGLRESVQLLGLRRDADRWLGCADLALLPSSNEGLSNTMLEAMGQATPVLATASGGVREHFTDGETLLLAGTEDEEGFVQRLLHALRHPETAAEIGRRGYQRVRERFRWEGMVRELEAVLASLIEDKRRGRP